MSACCGRRAAAASRSDSADPLAAPLIDPNFFGDADDLETMVAGFKMTRRLLDTPALRALQKKDMFTEGVRTDDDIRTMLRARVDTVYHPVGTCKMGVNDPMAVVDPKLKVYGVEGLRVVDASVMPTLIGGNTNAPTIMIGEKAADMIKAEMRARLIALSLPWEKVGMRSVSIGSRHLTRIDLPCEPPSPTRGEGL